MGRPVANRYTLPESLKSFKLDDGTPEGTPMFEGIPGNVEDECFQFPYAMRTRMQQAKTQAASKERKQTPKNVRPLSHQRLLGCLYVSLDRCVRARSLRAPCPSRPRTMAFVPSCQL